MPDDDYDKIWCDKYDYEDGFFEEERFAVHRTAYGDGCWEATDGICYGADAGNIAITDLNRYRKRDDDALNRLGKVVEVKESIIMKVDENCNFEFIVDGQSFKLYTDGSDYEEEEDEDYED